MVLMDVYGLLVVVVVVLGFGEGVRVRVGVGGNMGVSGDHAGDFAVQGFAIGKTLFCVLVHLVAVFVPIRSCWGYQGWFLPCLHF